MKTFDEIAAEQGWNADSREQILRDFINTGGQDLDDYALKRAFEENGIEHEGKKVPDFQMDVTGEYQGNAYPEPQAYRIRIAPHDEEFFSLTVENESGGIVGSVSLGDAEIDGIDKASLTDYSAPLEDGDWTFPAGMSIALTWQMPTDGDVYVVLDQGHIDQIANWFRYATGEKTWDWGTDGEEWEF